MRKDRPDDVLNFLNTQPVGTRFLVASPLRLKEGRTWKQQRELLIQQGFSRVICASGNPERISDILDSSESTIFLDAPSNSMMLLIDRLVVDLENDEFQSRVIDSVETAFFEGDGECNILISEGDDLQSHSFNDRFERDGIVFIEPSPDLFTFNSPVGACQKCEGFGHVIGIDPKRVIPDPRLSIYDDAIACWKGERLGRWKEKLCLHAYKVNLPIHTPWGELSEEQQNLVWNGGAGFKGLHTFFAYLEEKSYKIQFRVMLSRYSCLLYTSPSPRDRTRSRMPSSA